MSAVACPTSINGLAVRRLLGLLHILNLLKFVDRIPLVLFGRFCACPNDAAAGVAKHPGDEEGRHPSTHQSTRMTMAEMVSTILGDLRL